MRIFLVRAFRNTFGSLAAEIRRVALNPLRGGRHQPSRFTLAVGAAVVLLLLGAGYHRYPGAVDRLSAESAALTWPIALARLPLSALAPAPSLPMWGAFAQVLVVLGLAEMHMRRRLVVFVAFLAHTVATLSARAMLAVGTAGWWGLGLARQWLDARDTGPSAAIVGLGTYLGIKLRAPLLTTGLVAAMVVEVVVKPDLAGREHVVAIAVGALCAVPVLWRRSSLRSWLAGVRFARALPVDLGDEGIEEPLLDRVVHGRVLRVPLHAHHPGGTIELDHLDHAVVGAPGDVQALAEPVDRLVVVAAPGHLGRAERLGSP